MALEVAEDRGSSLIMITVTGKLVKEDYALFVPQVESIINRVGKVRILFIMKAFHGWDARGAWEDFKFGLHHFSEIERLAMVGDTKWEQWMASFGKPFTRAEIKYFDIWQLEAAREWALEIQTCAGLP